MSGKPSLPVKRRRRQYRETPDILDGICRFVAALGKRVATEDVDSLRLLRELDRAVERTWATAVAGLRTTGYSDREIGEQLGITRQAVQQRWPWTGEHEQAPPMVRR
jgi:hypothetical protein